MHKFPHIVFSFRNLFPISLLGSFFLFALPPLFAQSNEVIDQLLSQKEASFELSTYMVFTAAEKLPEELPVDQILDLVPAEEWTIDPPPAGESDRPITLGEYSYMLMESLDIKGGIMYKLFPGPRYAARELKFLGFLPGSSTTARHISGNEVLHILGRALEWKESR